MQKQTLYSNCAFALAIAIYVSRGTSPAFAQDAPAAPPSTVVKNLSPIDLTPLDLTIPPATEFLLPNGSHAFIVEDARTPLVTFTVSVRGGSLFEADGERGVADLVAASLVEGTKSYTAERIAELSDKYGASFGANAGDERATISLTCLAENADELLPVLYELVYAPLFPSDRVAKVRARAAAGASARASDPNNLAGDALRGALYGVGSVYGRPSPTPEQVSALAPDALAVFHGKHFRPDEAIIGVAGNVHADSTGSVLLRVFGAQSNPATPASVLPPASFAAQASPDGKSSPVPVVLNRAGSAQTVLTFGVPAIDRANPDYFPLLLANRILGGGFNSRLNQKLREEKGYTYGARSNVFAPKWTGYWSASASVRNPVTADAARAFVGEFNRLQTVPPKPGELDLVKQALIGNFALTLESPEAVLSRSIERYEYHLPADYYRTYAARVRAVTPDDVVRVARKYFGKTGDPKAASPAKVWAVAVGEKAQIEAGVTAAVAE